MCNYSNYEERLPSLREWLDRQIQCFLGKLGYNYDLSFLKNIRRGNNVLIGKHNQIKDTILGNDVRIYDGNHIYGCEIGAGSQIACGVTLQKGCKIGKNCKIGDSVFIPDGVTIEDYVFVGAGTRFSNDIMPRAGDEAGDLKGEKDWTLVKTVVRKGASLGINCSVLPGRDIGEGSLLGMGSVLTKDLPPFEVWCGNPAKLLRKLK
jgi:acetyltransferase-like isoleucine patch superfamily enzyme